MKKLVTILFAFSLSLLGVLAQSRPSVISDTDGRNVRPTNFFGTNVTTTRELTVSQDSAGKITLSLSGVLPFTTNNVPTNSTVNSNLTFTAGSRVTYVLSNSISVTNWSSFYATNESLTEVELKPQSVNRTLIWPGFGASYGTYWNSNLDGSVTAWSTLTAGVTYVWSIKQRGTNYFGRMTAWQ